MAHYPPSIRYSDFIDPAISRVRSRDLRRPVERSDKKGSRSNVVDVPTLGIKSLVIEVGGKTSRSRVRHSHDPIASDAAERVAFVPCNPATHAGGDKPKIKWTLVSPKYIRKAILEVFVRGQAAPVWRRDLRWKDGALGIHDVDYDRHGPADATDGELEWDGTFDAVPPGWEQACVGAARSPYKLKMTVVGTSRSEEHGVVRTPAEAWTYFDVLVGEIKLDWEQAIAKDTLRDDRTDIQAPWDNAKILALEKTICDDLHANAITANHEVLLESNLFTTDLDGQGKNDTLYRAYRDKWGKGPLIPLFARLKLVNAAGALVDAPWALGGAEVLWDWEDRGTDKVAAWLTNESAQSKDFVRDSLDYLKDAEADAGFAPRGSDNCHADHGGKRGKGAAPVFPPQDAAAAGYVTGTAAVIPTRFPFSVGPCLQRRWAAISTARSEGVLAGKTGVLFQPSRMAGDAYRISVYFRFGDDFPFDSDGPTLRNDLPAAIRDQSGLFETWRKVSVRVLRKTTGGMPDSPQANAGKIRSIFASAGIRLDITTGAVALPAWETAFNQVLADLDPDVNEPWFQQRRALVLPANVAHTVFDDQKTGPDAVIYRPRGAIVGVPDNNTWDMFYNGPQNYTFAGNFMPRTQRQYIDAQYPPPGPGQEIEGVFVFLYRQGSSVFPERLKGAAHSPTSTLTRATVYVAYNPAGPAPPGTAPDKYGLGQPQLKGADRVIAHEIAHALFIAHAVPETGAPDGIHLLCPTPNPTPAQDDACLMNYHPASRRFCGLCVLRLRGWSCFGPDDRANVEPPERLYQDGARNKADDFRIHRCIASLPATPPKTKRKMPGVDTYNLPTRAERTATSEEKDLTQNPPLVLLAATAPNNAPTGDVDIDPLIAPIRLRVEANLPPGGQIVWKVERAAVDHADVIAASPSALPTLTPQGNGSTATLLTDAIGTFHVMVSVDTTGGHHFDDTAHRVCTNVVMVGVTRVESDHAFTARHMRHEMLGADIGLSTHHNNDYPMKVKTKVRLLGGGADGRLGLDKVHGGWINNLRREHTEVRYDDVGAVNTWRATTYMVHKRPDDTLEAIAPPHDAAHPLVDCGGGGTMANWVPSGAVLSVHDPNKAQPLVNSAQARKREWELWITAKDGPQQGWDPEPPTQIGNHYSVTDFNLDLDFTAYLCFWTAHAPLLVGVLEEVPWIVRGGVEKHHGHYRLQGQKRVEMEAKTKHATLVAALGTGLECCPPTGKTAARPRNIVLGQVIGTKWTP